ncbi:MAG: TIGR00282 family metallophosphoesterase [Sphaerochaetaceae bacterium]
MSSNQTVTALILGDVIGQPGFRALFMGLPNLIKRLRADFVVLNGENADNGFGLNQELARQFYSLGVDVITSGNHIWQKEAIYPLLKSDNRLLRPANYNSKVIGKGDTIIEKKGRKFGVINLQGRHQMLPIDCPFQVGSALVDKMRKETNLIFVDFHAENAQEKEALGLYLDGKVSAIVGTHTHVQTADEKILPNKTAYITDLGMCGPLGGVIGSQAAIAIERQLTQLPLKSEILDGESTLQGVVVKVDSKTGKALTIERINDSFGL